LTELQTGYIGESGVEDDQIQTSPLESFQRLQTLVAGLGFDAFLKQIVANQFADLGVIFYYQNPIAIFRKGHQSLLAFDGSRRRIRERSARTLKAPAPCHQKISN